MGEYLKALSYYEKALEIREKIFPSNHPDLASTYNNIGRLPHNMSQYSKALSYYEKALNIREKILLTDHLSFHILYSHIGL
jgi:tetratricopeptide (TPR) repeat protein